MNKLLEEGVNPNSCCPIYDYFYPLSCSSALEVATYYGYPEIVKALLRAGANVNNRGGAQTPLRIAVHQGRVNIVNILLEAGADIFGLAMEDDTLISFSTRRRMEELNPNSLFTESSR